jgi:hypothetical protein
MTTKGNTNDIGWVKNIVTWAMLGIAAYQFSSLTNKVEKVHELVITHDAKLQNHKEEIDRLREATELNRTQLSARQ